MFEGPWKILKFGGTSVGDAANWPRIAAELRTCIREGVRPVVVHSAFSKVTDALEGVLDARAAGASAREALTVVEARQHELITALGIERPALVDDELAMLRDVADASPSAITCAVRARVLASGERMATAISAAWLQSEGLSTRWLDARDLLTSNADSSAAPDAVKYLAASCDGDRDETLDARLRAIDADVLVTQGFVVRDPDGATVVLGRGGSDTSAALLAARLGARRLEIWTDVPGTFTTNPREVETARLIQRVSIDEVATMASLGAKVLHPRSLEPVREHGIPMDIRWTRHPELGAGTRILPDASAVPPGIKAIGVRAHVVVLTMHRPPEWQPVGFMADIAQRFAEHGVSMDLLSSSPSTIKATIDVQAFPAGNGELDALVEDLASVCEVEVDHDAECVSFVGREASRDVARLANGSSTLRPDDIHFIAHAADDSHVTWVVRAGRGAWLLRIAHRTLFAEPRVDDVFGPMWTAFTRPAAPTRSTVEAQPTVRV